MLDKEQYFGDLNSSVGKAMHDIYSMLFSPEVAERFSLEDAEWLEKRKNKIIEPISVRVTVIDEERNDLEARITALIHALSNINAYVATMSQEDISEPIDWKHVNRVAKEALDRDYKEFAGPRMLREFDDLLGQIDLLKFQLEKSHRRNRSLEKWYRWKIRRQAEQIEHLAQSSKAEKA